MKLLLCLIFWHLSASANSSYSYGPAVVRLNGTLKLETFPGPPNFESISEGDEIERQFYLELSTPIDVLPSRKRPEAENARSELNVKIVQLAINPEDEDLWRRIRKLGQGAHLTISGSLFHQFTGHHHARVLLDVDKIHAK